MCGTVPGMLEMLGGVARPPPPHSRPQTTQVTAAGRFHFRPEGLATLLRAACAGLWVHPVLKGK